LALGVLVLLGIPMRSVLVPPIIGVCVLALSGALGAATRQEEGDPKSLKAECTALMVERRRAKADLKVREARLVQQAGRMNRALADNQTMLASLLARMMTEQRIAVQAVKTKMEDDFMRHMMRHLSMEKVTSAACPMMAGKSAK
jgi:hypothetical protein